MKKPKLLLVSMTLHLFKSKKETYISDLCCPFRSEQDMPLRKTSIW